MDDHDLLIRVDENTKAIKAWVEQHDCEHKDFYGRIGTLETERAKERGALTVISAGMGALAALFTRWFSPQ